MLYPLLALPTRGRNLGSSPRRGGRWGGRIKRIGITRAHLEEDAGKTSTPKVCLIVWWIIIGRRALLEIVTEPDIENGEEARVLTEIRNIIRYLGASSCDMEKGTMRVEPNISVRKPGETTLPKYKVEVKISIPSSLPKRLLTMRFIVKLKY